MRQVVQSLDHGVVRVVDVPTPSVGPHQVLVRTACSLISAGTERSKVELGQSSLIAKARRRPDDVRKVLDRVRREGLLETISMVRGRLSEASPLGYSCAGTVQAVGELVSGVRPGDRVACAGAGYANHADYVAVPQNLVAEVPRGVEFEQAAFTTLGAIALQGFRQSGATLGDRVAVIGLGLLGQLTVQIARAAGCEVVGLDLADDKLALAATLGASAVVRADAADAAERAVAATAGQGADAVLITAASAENAPVVLAGRIARDRATVVVVGDVRIDVPRSPFYEKELTVRLSRSYGPGRYDPLYEEYGIDYPEGYVRWTERANMQEFLRLLETGQVDVAPLITHRFSIDDAPAAYDLVTGKTGERFIGVVLSYGETAPRVLTLPDKRRTVERTSVSSGAGAERRERGTSVVGVSLIGAGNFATATLLPALKAQPGLALRGVVSSGGLSAGDVAERHGFAYAAADASEVFSDVETDLVVVATHHDTHARLVSQALRAGKHVFVEKPLAVTRAELEEVLEAYRDSESLAMVGFNRRFSPLVEQTLAALADVQAPRTVLIRVNAGAIPKDHWIQQLESGGGRIVGEMCHFVDLASCLASASPRTVHAAGVGNGASPALQDSLTAVITYDNGSLATVAYCSDGDTAAGKELVEVMCGGVFVRIDDFRAIHVTTAGRTRSRKLPSVDKGHKAEMRALIEAIRAGAGTSRLFAQAVTSTVATLAVIESLASGLPVAVEQVAVRSDE